jgi:hypothetical protein
MGQAEPFNLREWSCREKAASKGRLFTCGRLGRGTFGHAKVCPLAPVLQAWSAGLPECSSLHVVSLLGEKTSGFSEFDYYPFRSALKSGSGPSFQEWLQAELGKEVVVEEFPTVDRRGIPSDVLAAASSAVRRAFVAQRTVLVIDSAGAERTARVCELAGFDAAPSRD